MRLSILALMGLLLILPATAQNDEYWVVVHGHQGLTSQVENNDAVMAKLNQAAAEAGIKVVHCDWAHGKVTSGSLYDAANEVNKTVRAINSTNVTLIVHSAGLPIAMRAVEYYNLSIKCIVSFEGVTYGVTRFEGWFLSITGMNNFDPAWESTQQLMPRSEFMNSINKTVDYPIVEMRGWLGAYLGTDYDWIPLDMFHTFEQLPNSVGVSPNYDVGHEQMLSDAGFLRVAVISTKTY